MVRTRRHREHQDGPARPGPDPAIRSADGIRRGPARVRWEIEARLLAGQADTAIAHRLGVAADVVAAYEALFYAVRCRLGHPDWVEAVAIDPIGCCGVELAWKRFAYLGGPLVLEALIDPSGPGRPARDAEVDPPLGRLAGIIDSVEVTGGTATRILLLDAMAREIRSREVAAAAGPVVAPEVDEVIRAGYRAPGDVEDRPDVGATTERRGASAATNLPEPEIAPAWPYRATG